MLGDANARSTGRVLFDAALKGGAAALACGASGIVEGAAADLVSLDPHNPALIGRNGDGLIDAWVFAARSSPIDCVWAGGRKVVEGGRHRDRDAIVARFQRCVEGLLG